MGCDARSLNGLQRLASSRRNAISCVWNIATVKVHFRSSIRCGFDFVTYIIRLDEATSGRQNPGRASESTVAITSYIPFEGLKPRTAGCSCAAPAAARSAPTAPPCCWRTGVGPRNIVAAPPQQTSLRFLRQQDRSTVCLAKARSDATDDEETTLDRKIILATGMLLVKERIGLTVRFIVTRAVSRSCGPGTRTERRSFRLGGTFSRIRLGLAFWEMVKSRSGVRRGSETAQSAPAAC